MSKLKTICALMMMFAASAANGQTTWYVDDNNCPGPGSGTEVDPFCTIQAGIDAAVAANGDDVLVADGTYNELINFDGKAITLHSINGAAVTTIDGTALNDSVVKCISGEGPDTVLDGFTITGGNANIGGGMFNSGTSPTVTNCTFSGNSADFGGGMYNFNFNSPTLTNCTFSGNSAVNGGGAMFNDFSSNPTVANCTFSGNFANHGGGMYNFSSSSPTVTNCTFSGNSAVNGGGGGMINDVSSNPPVTNCTFSGNSADIGGGMYNFSSSSPTVTNCILWGDSQDEIVNDNSTPTVSFSDVQGGLSAGTIDGGGNIDADPLFVDADGADDTVGTQDDDLRLSAGSPAIDAGDTPAYVGPAADNGGNPRGVDDPSTPDTGITIVGTSIPFLVVTIDMGAHELQQLDGDLDHDGDVDLLDFGLFQAQFTGP